MMSQRYPNKHWARNFDPAHLLNHADWLLGNSVAQLKAVTATGQEIVSPAWLVVLRYELELRKEAMKLMNMTTVTIADDEATSSAHVSYLLLHWGQKQQQETRRDGWSADTKPRQQVPQPQPKASGKRQRRNKSARDSKRQKVAKVSQGGSTRYGRVKKHNPSMLHSRHNGKSICFAFPNPSGCSAGETCIHQHICAHCLGPTALTSVDHSMKLVPPT